jgi:hypothetical protein
MDPSVADESYPFLDEYQRNIKKIETTEAKYTSLFKRIDECARDYEGMSSCNSIKIPDSKFLDKYKDILEHVNEKYIPDSGFMKMFQINIAPSDYPLYCILNPSVKKKDKDIYICEPSYVLIENLNDFKKKVTITKISSTYYSKSNTTKIYSPFYFKIQLKTKIINKSEAIDLDFFSDTIIADQIYAFSNEIGLRLGCLKIGLSRELNYLNFVKKEARKEEIFIQTNSST